MCSSVRAFSVSSNLRARIVDVSSIIPSQANTRVDMKVCLRVGHGLSTDSRRRGVENGGVGCLCNPNEIAPRGFFFPKKV